MVTSQLVLSKTTQGQPSRGKEAEKQSSCLKGFVAQVSYAGKALEKGKGSETDFTTLHRSS